jgi:hypothetical protein
LQMLHDGFLESKENLFALSLKLLSMSIGVCNEERNLQGQVGELIWCVS